MYWKYYLSFVLLFSMLLRNPRRDNITQKYSYIPLAPEFNQGFTTKIAPSSYIAPMPEPNKAQTL
jgi:hypothetical protein